MKSLIMTTFVLATGAMCTTAAVPAQAQTCSSVCSQVRRACQHSAKGAMKAAYIACDETRDVCTADCEAGAINCLADCETAHADCVAGGGGSEACDAARTQCVDDCANCEADCGASRRTCRGDAKSARDAYRAGCEASRSQCRGSCVDPLDKTCVQGCTKDEHGCQADAKNMEGTCKKGCPKDAGRKSCMRACRKSCHLGEGLCGDVAVGCYAGCAGVELTTTTTTTLP